MGLSEGIILFAIFIAALLATPACLRIRGERRKRELQHIERMRAIEVGRSYPEEMRNSLLALPPSAIPYFIAGLIGALVPIVAFGSALLSSLILGFHEPVWLAAALVGIASVICGSILAITVFQKSPSGCESENSGSLFNSKPQVDEDAYDVVSSRG